MVKGNQFFWMFIIWTALLNWAAGTPLYRPDFYFGAVWLWIFVSALIAAAVFRIVYFIFPFFGLLFFVGYSLFSFYLGTMSMDNMFSDPVVVYNRGDKDKPQPIIDPYYVTYGFKNTSVRLMTYVKNPSDLGMINATMECTGKMPNGKPISNNIIKHISDIGPGKISDEPIILATQWEITDHRIDPKTLECWVEYAWFMPPAEFKDMFVLNFTRQDERNYQFIDITNKSDKLTFNHLMIGCYVKGGPVTEFRRVKISPAYETSEDMITGKAGIMKPGETKTFFTKFPGAMNDCRIVNAKKVR